MKHLDLFSGIGGFALATRWAGFETVGFSEIDLYASELLKQNWPGIPNLGDIKNWKQWPDIQCDLITSGFPCPPVSLAGKRRGAEDDRWLWPETLAVVKRFKPTWAIIENVAGLVSMELDTVLADLEGAGYAARTFMVPACGVDAPHRRNRVWIVANATGEQTGRVSERRIQSDACPSGRRAAPDSRRRRGKGEGSQERGQSIETRRQSQPGLCVLDDGLPERLAGRGGYRWPECTEPPISTGTKNRVQKLRALGNAIVPQIAFEFMIAIKVIEKGGGDA